MEILGCLNVQKDLSPKIEKRINPEEAPEQKVNNQIPTNKFFSVTKLFGNQEPERNSPKQFPRSLGEFVNPEFPDFHESSIKVEKSNESPSNRSFDSPEENGNKKKGLLDIEHIRHIEENWPMSQKSIEEVLDNDNQDNLNKSPFFTSEKSLVNLPGLNKFISSGSNRDGFAPKMSGAKTLRSQKSPPIMDEHIITVNRIVRVPNETKSFRFIKKQESHHF